MQPRQEFEYEDNLIYGLRPILEAIAAGRIIDKLFLQQDLKSEQAAELLSVARSEGFTVIKVPKEKLNKICRFNHQGAVAFASPIEFGNIEEIIQQTYERSETPLLLMLDKVNDVRNFGSIARSAFAAGCHAIIIPHKGSAAINDVAMKTSAGALSHIPICKVSSLGDVILWMKSSGIKTIACSEKAQSTIFERDFREPINFLFGNEGEGIEPHLVRMAGEEAAIPMPGEIGSLNVSVAVGVVLFEAVRQRFKP